MRTIKFRAWDGKRLFPYMSVGEYGVGYFEYVDSPENLRVMQYTGREDKNGNPVYEGDIVRYCESGVIGSQHYKNTGSPYASIYWSDSSTCFCIEDGIGTYLSQFYELEVIGNIYENLELIEVSA